MMKQLTCIGRFSPLTKKDIHSIRAHLPAYGCRINFILKEDGVSKEERKEIILLSLSGYDICFDAPYQKEEVISDEQLDLGIQRKNLSELKKKAAHYCIAHCLYIEEIAQRTLSEKRFYHVKCVAELSAALAVHYDIPYYKGYTAGLLHDITKEWKKKKQADYIARYYPERVSDHPKTYHQLSAQKYVQLRYQVDDEEILAAIGNHVNGTDDRLLSRIVFCADKIDDSRGFDNTEYKKLCFTDINKAYELIKNEQMRYLLKQLKKEGKKIDG